MFRRLRRGWVGVIVWKFLNIFERKEGDFGRAVNESSRAELGIVRVRLCSLRILKYCSCSCSFKLNELVRERYTNIEYVDEQLMNTFVNN